MRMSPVMISCCYRVCRAGRRSPTRPAAHTTTDRNRRGRRTVASKVEICYGQTLQWQCLTRGPGRNIFTSCKQPPRDLTSQSARKKEGISRHFLSSCTKPHGFHCSQSVVATPTPCSKSRVYCPKMSIVPPAWQQGGFAQQAPRNHMGVSRQVIDDRDGYNTASGYHSRSITFVWFMALPSPSWHAVGTRLTVPDFYFDHRHERSFHRLMCMFEIMNFNTHGWK